MTTKTNEILDRIREQYNKNKPREKKPKFTKEEREEFLKKYFNVTEEGEYIFRILPTKNGDSPFVEAYFHHLKINGQWIKLYCPHKNDSKPCPLCEAEEALKSTGKQEDFDLSRNYKSQLFYIVKGVDRNKIEEGVKFWRFKHNYKQQGIFDKIMPVFAKKGDITDVINGRDLMISATKTNGTNNVVYVTVSSIMPDDSSRLVEDDVKLKEFVDDKLTWKEVYKSKDVEYLKAVVEGKAPYWDDNQKKFITPGGKKTLTSVPLTETTTEEVSFDNVVETAVEELKAKKVLSKVDKKIKKQTEEIFENAEITGVVNNPANDDLPF